MVFSQESNIISWTQFLEAKALELNLTRTQTKVFLTRFNQDNWLNRIEDIWELSDVNSCEAFVKHSTIAILRVMRYAIFSLYPLPFSQT